jgi:hypothetical protein
MFLNGPFDNKYYIDYAALYNIVRSVVWAYAPRPRPQDSHRRSDQPGQTPSLRSRCYCLAPQSRGRQIRTARTRDPAGRRHSATATARSLDFQRLRSDFLQSPRSSCPAPQCCSSVLGTTPVPPATTRSSLASPAWSGRTLAPPQRYLSSRSLGPVRANEHRLSH